MLTTSACGEVRKTSDHDQVVRHLTLDEWQVFADSHPDCTIFHHRNWIKLLIDTYGFQLHIPAVKQNGQIMAAVPFLGTRNIWGARKLISLPFSDCMSILSQCGDAVRRLRKELTTDKYRKYRAIVLRTEQPFRPNGSAPWGRHVIDTSRSFNEITANFERSLRTNLRRAEKRKLTFQFSIDRGAFEEFYHLFLRTRRGHGLPIQPKSFFTGLYERLLLQNLGSVGLVRNGDAVTAAGVFLHHGGKMTCKYLASDPNALDSRPNEFLMVHAVRMAVEMGHSTFDFGISKREQVGLRRFKRKFGAIENDVYHDYVAGNVQPLVEDSLAMKIVAATIRNSPTVVCRAVGALVYRYSQ